MRYPCNHICFPCRRSARVGFVSPKTRSRSTYPPVPKCPSCGNTMLVWNSEIPGREQDWLALERQMRVAYDWDMARQAPDHPEHHLVKYRDYSSYRGLIGHGCAPRFFREMTVETT